VSSSSYAESVDSLENEPTEGSQNDETIPGLDEYATVEDILHEFRPLIEQLPTELSIELGRTLAFLTERWLDNQNIQQRPVPARETPRTSDSNAAEASLTAVPPSGTAKKRASSNEYGSFSPGEGNRGGGNGKRPKNTLDQHSESTTRRWACPYYQREPHRYCLGKWRLCAKSPGFSEVHRVK
jgi:hypothetical protein